MRVEPLKLLPLSGARQLDNGSVAPVGEKNFGQYLTEALDNVNKLQLDSQQASVNLAAGKVQDISEVVIATEKATVALQMTMQVRNKIMDAYQEIMRMQV